MEKDNTTSNEGNVKLEPKNKGGIKNVAKKKKRKGKGEKHPLKNPEAYEQYKYWKSLPTMWKGMKRDDLIEKFGIEDEDMLSLLEIRWQGEFAKKVGVDITTLTKWNKRMDDEGFDHLEEIRKWADRLTKNVTLAHYNKLIRKFDPVSADVWYKTISRFSEKKLIQHSGKLSLLDLAKQIDDEERELAQKGDTEDQE